MEKAIFGASSHQHRSRAVASAILLILLTTTTLEIATISWTSIQDHGWPFQDFPGGSPERSKQTIRFPAYLLVPLTLSYRNPLE